MTSHELRNPATEAHELHMLNLSRIATTQGRREYIDGVERAEGRFAAKWIRDELLAQFEAKKVQR